MNLAMRALLKARRIALRKTVRLRSPARVAIIGCGAIAPEHLYGYQEAGNGQVIAVSDVRPGAMARALRHYPNVRAFRDTRRMLDETRPVIVDICTWPDSHLEMVRIAAEYGVKGILCEKPLALQMSEIEEMLALCDAAGIKLGVGHQYRFHPDFRRAAKLVADGALGKVVEARGYIRDSLANNGPHLLDTLRFLLGDAPALHATAECERHSGKLDRGWPVEDGARGTIVFDPGTKASILTGTCAPSSFAIQLKGERGELEAGVGHLELNGKLLSNGDDQRSWYLCRRSQFNEFVRWVEGKQSSYAASAERGALSTELVLAMYESAKAGEPIAMPLHNKGNVIGELYPHESVDAASVGTRAGSNGELPRDRSASSLDDESLAMNGGPRVMNEWFRSGLHVGLRELAGVTKVLLSKQLGSSGGTEVRALERDAASLYGSPVAVASTSGTAALHVALAALNPEPYSEIITTPMTDMGSVIPILFSSCVPIFADIHPVTGNLTAETIAAKLTARTAAVIVVHLFGRPADLGPITRLLEDKGVALIEDCAQAHYADYEGNKVGTIGDMGTFSLQQSKQISCGDGGFTLINNERFAERAALFTDKGWNRKAKIRSHVFLGMNYRMTELQGAVARAQLGRLQNLIQARQRAADRLTELLQETPGMVLPQTATDTRSAWWLYNFCIDESVLDVDPDIFCEALQVEGVDAMRQYLPRPLFEEKVLADRVTFGTSGHPFGDDYHTPSLGEFPGLREFFRRQIILPWSDQATPRHAESIAAAAGKVAASATNRSAR